jgi:hypothetical protein
MRTYQHYAGYKSGYWDTMQQLHGARQIFTHVVSCIVTWYCELVQLLSI